MHKLDELRDMLMDELEKCSSKGELSTGSLEVIDKLAHAIKSIDTIIAMEGYSEDGMSYGNSYARGRNARRDSMGRYSRNRGSYDYNRDYRGSYRGYSRDDAKEELVDQLRDIANETNDPEMKKMVHKLVKEVED